MRSSRQGGSGAPRSQGSRQALSRGREASRGKARKRDSSIKTRKGF